MSLTADPPRLARARSAPLQMVKLRSPRVRQDELRRDLLVQTLRMAAVPVVAVRAGAGYGKTTTVRQWVDADERPAAWVTVDAGDNDPVRLLRHLVAALDGIEPLTMIVELLAVEPPAVEHRVMPELAAALAAGRAPCILVVDDVHLLTGAEAADLLEWLVAALPDGSVLALVGRAMPPMRLTRYVVSEDALVLRRDDLAFTPRECRAVTEKLLPDLARSEADALAALTEGWPAGLYLALLALRKRAPGDVVVADLPRSGGAIEAYFHEELLRGLDPAVTAFLMRTSVLDRLSGPFCDAVLQTSGSARLLRELASSDNLFVVALDDEPDWFRYHRLFADLLLAELRAEAPEEEAPLRRRAARWLADHGDADRAVDQAIAGGDLDLAEQIIQAHSFDELQSGRVSTLERWLASFPEAEVRRRPLLTLVGGWIAMASGRTDEVAACLELLEGGSVVEPLPDGTATLEVARAALAMLHGGGGVAQAAADAKRVRQAGPSASPWWSTACLIESTATQLADPRADGLVLGAAAELATRGEPASHALALAHLAWAELAAGHEERGQAASRQAVEELRAHHLDDFTLTFHVHAVHAYAAARRGAVEESERASAHAQAMFAQLGATVPRAQCHIRLVLAEAALRRGAVADARALLDDSRTFLDAEPDAAALWAWVERLAEEVAAREHRHDQVDRLGITDAELRVLALLPSHKSLEEIGEALYVSRNTVKTHVVSIYRKLAVSSRGGAVDRAAELGLVPQG